MNEKLNQELVKLQDELFTLSKAVEHISKAEKIASTVLSSSEEIQKQFAKRLDEIVFHYTDYLEKTKAYAEDNISELTQSHLELTTDTRKMLDEYTTLGDKNIQLIEKIDSINFPDHLNRLEIKSDETKSLIADSILEQENKLSAMKEFLNEEFNLISNKEFLLEEKNAKLAQKIEKLQAELLPLIKKANNEQSENHDEQFSKILEVQSNLQSEINTIKITAVITAALVFILILLQFFN